MTPRYILGWFVLLIAAMVNGVARDAMYKDRLGELAAHQLSTVTGIILFGVIIWGMNRLWPITSSKQAWTIGGAWLVMTVAFEFLFFHYVTGHSWNELLDNYDILEGRLWTAVLLWTLVSPYVFFRFRSRHS